VPPPVAQAKTIGHLQITIRQHGGTNPVLGMTLPQLSGRIGTDSHNLDIAFVELITEFFPSP
jgi:hypothetical protein